jgi:cytochrome c oxidase assembly factor CtaG
MQSSLANFTLGIGQILALLIIAGFAAGYVWGWQRLRHALPALATRLRLVAFSVAILALLLALVWPLPNWSNYLLAMRSLQKVLICMVAAPLLWLAAPVHLFVWGVRGWARHSFVALMSPGPFKRIVQKITQPVVAWFFYVSIFLFWHDPSLARFVLGETRAHTAAPWLLLSAAILFWWPVVDTGPRLYRRFPAWLLVVYLLSVEIANMVAGITIAFSMEPLYPYYTALRAQLGAGALPWNQTIDQIAGGAIVWVFGSLVYISSIVFVLFRLFHKEGSSTPLHLPNWDDHEKFIAPGLEHRAAQNKLRNADLSHH